MSEDTTQENTPETELPAATEVAEGDTAEDEEAAFTELLAEVC